MSSLYFAYGSNMNFTQMHYRCEGANYIGRARLDDWSYFINSNGYAGIEISSGSQVFGCLWLLDQSHFKELDKYEAVEEGFYTRIEVLVFDEQSLTRKEAIVYLSNNREYGLPTETYQRGILQGAQQVGLPIEYSELLESWSEGKAK
jgi:gamma-glutamylcyclotransferase (GGCT)/AIG2-like uncharacterized protein YtfP